jgi:hypothetical protein
MRFRIWHLLAAMAAVAVWASLAPWLQRLEASDHPQRPQTMLDLFGMYFGTAAIVGIVVAGIWFFLASRRSK